MANIYHHRRFRDFIQEWMSEKEGKGRSLRAVAKRIGKSPGGLSKILAGDRVISEEITDLLILQMKLGADEAAYFRILVECEQAPSEPERDEAILVRDAIFGFRNAQRLDPVQAKYFSSWVHPAIVALAGCRGFRADPEWIAAKLQPAITPAEAKRAMEYLLNIRFLVEEDGELRPPDKLLRTEAKVDDGELPEGLVLPEDPEAAQRRRAALKGWHRWLRRRAVAAMDEYPREELVFNAMTVRVSEAKYSEFVRRMEHLQAELLKICDSEEPGDRVYQLTISLYPASAPTADD